MSISQDIFDNNVTLNYEKVVYIYKSANEIIEKIGRGLKVNINEKIAVKQQCSCSREKVEGMLAALPDKDLQEIELDEVTEVNCHFCNKSYKFKNTEIQAMKR